VLLYLCVFGEWFVLLRWGLSFLSTVANIEIGWEERLRIPKRPCIGWDLSSVNDCLCCFSVDYLHPDDVRVDAGSSLLEPGRLEQLVPPPGRHRRPHTNVIQPLAELHQPRPALPGPGQDGNVLKRGGDEVAGGEETVASADDNDDDDDDEDAGYSSDDDDDN